MVMFYFFFWVPAGFIFHYLLYGRGAACSWWLVAVFLVCAHWPNYSLENKDKTSPTSTAVSQSKMPPFNSFGPGFKVIPIIWSISEKSKPKDSKPKNFIQRKCTYFLCNNYEKQYKAFKVWSSFHDSFPRCVIVVEVHIAAKNVKLKTGTQEITKYSAKHIRIKKRRSDLWIHGILSLSPEG